MGTQPTRTAPTGASTRRAPLTVLTRRRDRVVRMLRDPIRWAFAGLSVLVLVSAYLTFSVREVFTAAVLAVPLLLADLLLPPRRARLLVGLVFAVLTVETVLEFPDGIPLRRWVAIGIVVTMGAVLLVVSWRRSRLGVAGLLGDSMLLDLRDRITRHGRIPALSEPWYVESAARSAGGTSFAGDFVVAHLHDGGSRLSLVMVDVSGKGVDAGTRSLLLSGAFGGLLGAVPDEDFLVAANEFLIRQGWEEGFATAVHLALDLDRGTFEVRRAGHPPAIQFVAGSGRWLVLDQAEGPLLGLVPGAQYPARSGRLGTGDALLLYTDGLVERRRSDIALGIDKLVGEGERWVRRGFVGAAADLVARLGARDDDCALLVLQRR